jgi:protein-disulfide isomerase
MKREFKILAILSSLLVAGGVIAVYSYNSSQNSLNSTKNSYGISLREEFVRDDSPALGPKTASVTLVEFLDPECESCRAFFPTVKRILKEFEGQIHFVVRYMPFHASSLVAIAATEAAGLQGKYWEMQELLFMMADEWGHQPSPRKDLFIKYATSLGLDTSKFTQDLEDPRWVQKAQRDMADGKLLGVSGTPTLFVNGDRVSKLTYQDLKLSINQYLYPERQ